MPEKKYSLDQSIDIIQDYLDISRSEASEALCGFVNKFSYLKNNSDSKKSFTFYFHHQDYNSLLFRSKHSLNTYCISKSYFNIKKNGGLQEKYKILIKLHAASSSHLTPQKKSGVLIPCFH